MEAAESWLLKRLLLYLDPPTCHETSGIMKPNDGAFLKAEKNLGNTSSNDSPAQSAELYYFTSYNTSLLCSVKMLSLVTTAVK